MKKVFSKVVLPLVIVSGGAMLFVANEKSKEGNETEYSYVTQKSLEELIITEDQLMKPYIDIQDEAKERHQEFLRQEKVRMAKIQAKIDAEVARIKAEDKRKEEERQRKVAEQKRLAELKKQEAVKRQQAKKQEVKKQQSSKAVDTSNQSGWMTFNGSYYGADCYQCSGITATGINVQNTIYYQGYRIVALDPNIVPLWSLVEVKTPNETFTAVVGDTGGRIKGFNADILVESESRSSQLGRHNIQIRVIGSLK